MYRPRLFPQKRSRLRIYSMLATTVAVVLGMMAGPTPPADAETSPATFVAERTTTAAAHLRLSFTATYARPPGSAHHPLRLGVVGVIDGQQRDAFGGAMLSLSDDSRYGGAYAPGVRVHLCGDLGHGCGVTGTVGAASINVEIKDDGGARVPTRLLLVAEAKREVTVHLHRSDGWRVRRVPLAFVFADRDQTTAVGIDAPVNPGGFMSTEVFLEARLPGFSGGSVAMAELPCSRTGTGIPRGVGRASLLGGRTEPTLACPYDPVTLAGHLSRGDVASAVDEVDYARRSRPVADYSPDATEWILRPDGAAVGQTTLAEARLLVVGLPELPTDLSHLPWAR